MNQSGPCKVNHTVTRESSVNTYQHHCVVDHIRESCWEALAEVTALDLSPTGDPKHRPEYWVGVLEYLLGQLLIATESPDSPLKNDRGSGVVAGG